MNEKRRNIIFRIGVLVVFVYIVVWLFYDPILRERKRKQIGKYVIDMERTEWGEYEAEKDNYKDLTIVFKKDKTFEVNRTVPFLLDTTGWYVVRGRGKVCGDICFSSWIEKRSFIEKICNECSGDWLWPCWEDSPGDSVTAIIGPAPKQNEQRRIHKLYFKKIGKTRGNEGCWERGQRAIDMQPLTGLWGGRNAHLLI